MEPSTENQELRVDKEPGKLEMFRVVTDGLFRKIFAVYIFSGGGAFLWKAAFKSDTVMNLVVGFVIGTLLSTILVFFFGSSQSSQDKDKRLAELNKKEVI